jgi:DNA-binding NarL/FixJ family response regulator
MVFNETVAEQDAATNGSSTSLVAQVQVLVAEARSMAADTMEHAIVCAEGLALTARCTQRAEVVLTCASTPPDVAVLDLGLYGHDPGDAVRSVREPAPEANVLLMVPELNMHERALATVAGADNCISAFVGRDAFVQAIRATAAGEPVVPADLCRGLGRAITQLSADRNRHLSPREIEVLRLAAEGLSVMDIATELCVSANTARTHLRRTYRKLGAHNRCGAVAEATRVGILH